MTVNGTDVSHWNENPPLDLFDFIIHKCTQGTKFSDDRYPERQQWARDRGKIWGAYHFYTPGLSPAVQVQHFADHANIGPGDIVAVDFEDDETWHFHSSKTLADECNKLMRLMHDRFPENRVVLYCNRSTWLSIVQPYEVFLGDGLWIASPGTIPQMEWVLWQYGHGSVDYDRASFNTLADLVDWLHGEDDINMPTPADIWAEPLDYEAPGSRNNPDPNHTPYSERKSAGQTLTDAYYYAADALKSVNALSARLDALEGALTDHEAHFIAALRQALDEQPPDQVTLTSEQAGQLVAALPQAVQDGLRAFFAQASAPPD